MAKLRELDASFVRYIDYGNGQYGWEYVDTLAEADGLWFYCPKCEVEGRSHGVLCWFDDKVPDGVSPGPGRWNPQGTSLDDLSFVPGKKSHSVQLNGGCMWHGYVCNGEAL